MDKVTNKKYNIEEYRRGIERLTSFPQVVYIETTNACNLKCPMCPITMGIEAFTYPVKYFPWENFVAIEPLLAYAERCIMSGGGEPLLHPRFLDMVSSVKRAGAQTIFNTNATLLTEKIAKELVRLQADTISFSVDGATPETYAKIRVGGDLETVRRNIARLVEIKRSDGAEKPFLNLQMTLQAGNRAEIIPMVEFAAKLGIRHLVIEPLTPVFGEDERYSDYLRKHALKADEVADDIRAAKKRSSELGLIFSSHYLVLIGDEPGYGDAHSYRCVEPWINIGFRTDGTIFPCCGTSHTMGRLGASSLLEWNNAEYLELRSAFAKFKPPSYCELCIREGRAMRFNEDLVGGGICRGVDSAV